MKNKSFLQDVFLKSFILFILMIGLFTTTVFAAVPADENYENNGSFTTTSTSADLDGIRYTFDKLTIDDQVNTYNDGGNVVFDFPGKAITISLVDGGNFKLAGFDIDVWSKNIVYVTPEGGTAIELDCNSSTIARSLDFTTNTDFDNISSFTISTLNDMSLRFDNLDFENPIESFFITYNCDNKDSGTVPTDSGEYSSGDPATIASNSGSLLRTGYTFAGWNSQADGEGTDYTVGQEVNVISDMTLYAKWIAIDYSVTYNGDGSTSGSVPIDSNVYNIENVVTVLGQSDLVKTGWTFIGWNTTLALDGTNYLEGDTFTMGSSDVNLYANWEEDEYNITYNSNSATSGSAPTDGTAYKYNNTATTATNSGSLSRTGYTFAGWNSQADGEGTDYTVGQEVNVTSDMTLYAKWIAIDYSVTYNGDGSTSGSVPIDSNVYNIGKTVTVLGQSDLVKTGWTFIGWNTTLALDGTNYLEDDTFTMGSSDVNLYANWEEDEYNITYNSNSATSGSAPTDGTAYKYNNTATTATNSGSLSRTGYTFAGWNSQADGEGTDYTVGQEVNVTSDMTLYAKWIAIDYSVTYNGDGSTSGSVPIDSNVYNIENVVTVLGQSDLVKTGWTFIGWNTTLALDGTNYLEGDTFTMGSSDVNLYANWEEDEYNITYNSNSATSGSAPTDGTAYKYNNTATTATNSGSLSRTGYTFAGWNSQADGEGTDYTVGQEVNVTSDMTLYAKWIAIDYSVTYNSDGSTSGSVPIDSNVYNIGKTVTVLGQSDLVKTGWTFIGWNTTLALDGTNYLEGDTFTMGSSDVNLYANWEEDEYNITYNSNSATSGSAPTDGTAYKYNNTATTATNSGSLSRTGYTFAGWNSQADGEGTDYTVGQEVNVTSDMTLYAKWIAIDYSVTYNSDGSTSGSVPIDSNVYNIENVVTVLGQSDLVKTGWTFIGWNTTLALDGTNYLEGDTFTMGSSDVNLYANWEEDEYNITYNSNSATSGSAPTDGTAYKYNNTATTATNSGSLSRTGYTFAGWNSQADGEGTDYTVGQEVNVTSDMTLYAKWEAIDYSVTYNSNGSTSGSVPTDSNVYYIGSEVTVLGQSDLTNTGFIFNGWNTKADGSGFAYKSGNKFNISNDNITLYAQWQGDIVRVLYNGNGNTLGSVPTDSTEYDHGDDMVLLPNYGNLSKTGYVFDGWKLSLDESALKYSPGESYKLGLTNVVFYANWQAIDYKVTYYSNGSNSGTVAEDTNIYHIGDSVIVKNNVGSLSKSGYYFSGWNTMADGTGTSYSPSNSLVMGPDNVSLYAQWKIKSTSSSSSSKNSSTTTTTSDDSPKNDESAKVLVNGKNESAGTLEKKKVDGKVTTTVKVDSAKIEKKLEEKSGDTETVITIPVSNKTDVAIGQLTGNTIKAMENKDAIVEIKTEKAIYKLPAEEIKIEAVARELEKDVNLKNVKVNIEISKASNDEVKIIEDNAKKGSYKVMVPPVDFKVKCSYGNRTIEVHDFKSYIERSIVIPENVDPSKITTAVVLDSDGTMRHIPTKVTLVDGIYYAKVNSLTNSCYTLVYNEMDFSDIEKHWAKNTINDMGARMIINGVDGSNYEPDRYVSRGEFLSIVTKGLGLQEGIYNGEFADVSESDWYSGVVATSLKYNYSGSEKKIRLNPQEEITREEAIEIIKLAIKSVSKKGDFQLTEEEKVSILSKYSDFNMLSDKYSDSVAYCLDKRIIVGSNNMLRPKEKLTRAETAVLIKRMLYILNLI